MAAAVTPSSASSSVSVHVPVPTPTPVPAAAPASPAISGTSAIGSTAAKVIGPTAAADSKEAAAGSGKLGGANVSVEKTLTLAEIKAKLANEVTKTIKEIAQDNINRMNGKVDNPLAQGIFYAIEYCQALKQRSEDFRKKSEALKAKLENLPKEAAQQAREKVQSQISEIEKIRKSIDLRFAYMVKEGIFIHGTAPEEFFSRVLKKGTPTGKLPQHYRLQPGKKPGEALDALRNGVTLISCGEACQIAFYTAIQRVLGQPKFDAVFSNNAFLLAIGMGRDSDFDHANPINRLLRPYQLQNIRQAEKGQMVYFKNIKEYPVKHYSGVARGYNLICCKAGKDPEFAGFGIDPKGVTKAQVVEILRKAFNAEPIQFEQFCTQEMEKKLTNDTFFNDHKIAKMMSQAREALKNTQLSAAEFSIYQSEGVISPRAWGFDVPRIAQLASLSIQEACCKMEAWCKEDPEMYMLKQMF